MDADSVKSLRHLLIARPIAALATLHGNEPRASMVPFLLVTEAPHILIHVSALAAHTSDMLAHQRVSLLVTAEEQPSVAPQATPRVSLQADAEPLSRELNAYLEARARYLDRFPDAAVTLELADFSFFVLRPISARLVAGFAQARSLSGERLLAWLRGA